ncbi:MAG: hypothetical protein ABL994_21730 [Verrucomicrobiales bacterium]
MRSILIKTALVLGALLGSGCANVSFIGHRERIGIDAEFSGASPTPAEILVGQTQNTIIAIPPKDPNRSGSTHKGDLLSSASFFGVKNGEVAAIEAGKIPTPSDRFDLTIKSQVFTGRAANVLTGSDNGAPYVESAKVTEMAPLMSGPTRSMGARRPSKGHSRPDMGEGPVQPSSESALPPPSPVVQPTPDEAEGRALTDSLSRMFGS